MNNFAFVATPLLSRAAAHTVHVRRASRVSVCGGCGCCHRDLFTLPACRCRPCPPSLSNSRFFGAEFYFPRVLSLCCHLSACLRFLLSRVTSRVLTDCLQRKIRGIWVRTGEFCFLFSQRDLNAECFLPKCNLEQVWRVYLSLFSYILYFFCDGNGSK